MFPVISLLLLKIPTLAVPATIGTSVPSPALHVCHTGEVLPLPVTDLILCASYQSFSPVILLWTAPPTTTIGPVFLALLVLYAGLQLAGREADASRNLPEVVVSVASPACSTLPVPGTVLQPSVSRHPVKTLVEIASILVTQGDTVTVIYTPKRHTHSWGDKEGEERERNFHI